MEQDPQIWVKNVLMPRILNATLNAAREMAGDIQKKISKPVGPNGQRSVWGEAPRKDTGQLHDSIKHYAKWNDDQVLTVSVSANTPYAAILEDVLNRPYITGEADRFVDMVIVALERAINA
jgi:hypothetical protein